MGRKPQPVPQDKADSIIEWISEGKTLRDWSRQPGNVSFVAVYDWLNKDPDFALRFARARETGEDVIAQECLAIADSTQVGEIVTHKADGSREVKQADMIEHRKLRIETRLKLLAKWNPKKWGERLDMNVTGSLDIAGRLAAARDRLKK